MYKVYELATLCIYIYIYTYMYIHIYMYMMCIMIVTIGKSVEDECDRATANLLTNILDFRGFDSSKILILWVGIPRSIGNSPEVLSRRILVGIVFAGRSGVPALVCVERTEWRHS